MNPETVNLFLFIALVLVSGVFIALALCVAARLGDEARDAAYERWRSEKKSSAATHTTAAHAGESKAETAVSKTFQDAASPPASSNILSHRLNTDGTRL